MQSLISKACFSMQERIRWLESHYLISFYFGVIPITEIARVSSISECDENRVPFANFYLMKPISH